MTELNRPEPRLDAPDIEGKPDKLRSERGAAMELGNDLDNAASSEMGSTHFEQLSQKEMDEMLEKNPDALSAMNKEYQEKESAAKLGYTPEEYRAHLDRIKAANGEADGSEEKEAAEGGFYQNYATPDVPAYPGRDSFPEQDSYDYREKRGLSESEQEKVNGIVAPHYDKAREITENATKHGELDGEHDYTGANFTDHNEAHIKMVEAKTTEGLDACVDANNANRLERADASGDVHFSSNVDYKVTQAAALSHDTGMSNDLYHYDKNKGTVEKQNGRDFDSVRNNHCINSALNVLANREQYKEAGFSDEQIDDIAMLTFSHSKSNSGIRDLNSSADWQSGVDKLSSFVDKYNEDHPDRKISFEKERYTDKEKLGVLSTESLALRVGDVSRDSGPDAVSQSGEKVHVDRNGNDVSLSKNWADEINGFDVTVGDEKLTVTDDMADKDAESIRKSKQVHVGEQNIVENHTTFEDGKLTHTITVNDGSHAPLCTAEAIKDHLGELASAKNGDFTIKVDFTMPWDDNVKAKYNSFRDSLRKRDEFGNLPYQNVEIKYPWDRR